MLSSANKVQSPWPRWENFDDESTKTDPLELEHATNDKKEKSKEWHSLAEELVHNLGVGLLVAGLVSCNGGADLAQLLVAVPTGVGGRVAVGHLCGTLLEGGIDEA
jgi:hypothetical protein